MGLGTVQLSHAAILLIVVVPIYLLPTIIAVRTHKRNAVPIVILNVLGGLTVIGWLLALVWSLTYEKHDLPAVAEP